ncbi:MAG TPA: hypothetical protein VK446_04960 [Methylocystis sp.]|nr:hypothetical protein [Methylocystis sp.]
MRSLVKYIFLTLAAALIGGAAYETYAVIVARQTTKQLFSKYETATDNGARPPSALSPEKLEILVKVQDPNFWSHGGVDWRAPLATTVTQSIVKKLYFKKFGPGIEKIEQTLVAYFAVGPLASKNAQLAAFIDMNGFDALSWRWFGKPLDALEGDDYLALIATNNTTKFAPGTKENAERVARIKRYLAGACERRDLADVWLDRCAPS